MAEVDCRLFVTSVSEETNRHLIDMKAEIKQIEVAIIEAMDERRNETRSAWSITEKEAEEPEALHGQCYNWLRRVKQSKVECKSLRLYAQAKRRRVKSVLNRLEGVQIWRGSAHRKVKAIIDAVSHARWRLKAVGAEQELFGKKVVIGSLVSRLEEGTQAR